MNERTDRELLPCPFCGGEDATLCLPTCTQSAPYNPLDRAFPSVFCPGCFVSMPGENWNHSGDSAIAAWNNRAAAAMAEGGEQ